MFEYLDLPVWAVPNAGAGEPAWLKANKNLLWRGYYWVRAERLDDKIAIATQKEIAR